MKTVFVVAAVYLLSVAHVSAEECFNRRDISRMFQLGLEEFCGGFKITANGERIIYDGEIDMQSDELFKQIAVELADGIVGNAKTRNTSTQTVNVMFAGENARKCNVMYAKMKKRVMKKRCFSN